jgi:hypothetical protein
LEKTLARPSCWVLQLLPQGCFFSGDLESYNIVALVK